MYILVTFLPVYNTGELFVQKERQKQLFVHPVNVLKVCANYRCRPYTNLYK